MKPKATPKTIFLTDEQMRRFSKNAHERYPFIYRENSVYDAELESMWRVTLSDERDIDLVPDLDPCELGDFELITD